MESARLTQAKKPKKKKKSKPGMCHHVPKGCSVPLTRGSRAGSATRATRATGLRWINPAGNSGGKKKLKKKLKMEFARWERCCCPLVSPGEGLCLCQAHRGDQAVGTLLINELMAHQRGGGGWDVDPREVPFVPSSPRLRACDIPLPPARPWVCCALLSP